VTTGYTSMHAIQATYAPFGGLASVSLGPTPTLVTNVYNNRLQPLLLSAVAGSTTVMSLCYDFHSGVALSSAPCSFPAYTSGNNGNVFQIVNNRDNTRTQNFTYDSLNRISQAYSSGTNWGEAFTIDPWGNLTNRAGVTGKTNTEPLNAPATAQNRLTGYGYDAAGNMTSNGSASYVYDAENRLIATAGMSYVYDGDGKRVEKCTEGATPGTCASGATGTLYWPAWGNDPLVETDLTGVVLRSYLFFNGQRLARRDSADQSIHYYFSDHLGSHGVVTNMAGTTCEQDIDYYPYGGVENDYCPTVAQHYKFTGKERDVESGLDYFGARHYGSNIGRFASPDRYNAVLTRQGLQLGGLGDNAADAFLYGYIENPQNWNKYAYVLNTPARMVDRTGAAPADGHHLLTERDTYTGIAKDFADKIKTGPLSGSGAPNQPGFNEAHRAYNAAVEQALEEAEETMGDRNAWSVSQWKEVATRILNSQVPAIRNFLDELEENNPGAKAALSAAIAGYRVSAAVFARVVAAAVATALADTVSDFFFVILLPSQHHDKGPEAETVNPHRRHCLIDRSTNQCVN